MNTKRHRGKGPERPDGVGVPKQEQRRSAACKLRAHMVPLEDVDLAAERLELAADALCDDPHAG